MKRHQHNVMDVCRELIMDMTGTGDGMSVDSFLHYTAWLCWRVEEGWIDGIARMVGIDEAVRFMARTVALKAAQEAVEKATPTKEGE